MKFFPIVLLALVITVALCAEDFESATEGSEDVSSENREPLAGIDYVEGEFGDRQGAVQPNIPASDLDAQNLFQQFGGVFGNEFFNPFTGFGGFGSINANYKPWYRGPNVCTSREEETEDDEKPPSATNTTSSVKPSSYVQHFSLNVESCQETNTKHTCKRITNVEGRKKTVTITKQCCHGFAHQRGGFCEKVDLKSISDTAEELGCKQFVKAALSNDLQEMMASNVTIFMPTDSSFTEFSESMTNANLVVAPIQRTRRQNASGLTTKNLIMNHIVNGWVDIEDVDNEQLLHSSYHNSTIRMNVFPKIRNNRYQEGADESGYRYLYTANCIPVVKPNKLAANGIIHMVKDVIVPVEQNIMEIIRSREDMSVLRTVLERTKMDKLLDGTDDEDENSKKIQKQFSIFAPTDSAFEKLDPQLKRKIKEGAICAENILKNHILDLTFCSSVVVNDEGSRVTTYNMLGERMSFERAAPEEKEKQSNEISEQSRLPLVLINDKARIVEEDIMGTNGVLHVIDTVLETESGLPISMMLEAKNLTTFRKLMEHGSYDDSYDNLDNATFFVPSNEAFESSEVGKYWIKQLEEAPQKLKNNEKLKELLDYHVVQPVTRSCDLSEKMLPTLANNQPLRVNLYTTHPGFSRVMNRATVNCARLVHFDQDSCGSVMHQIDKVLSPPTGNLLELLQAMPQYSQFLKFVRKANLTSLLEESSDSGLTLFVPKDDVFDEVSEWIAEMSQTEQEELIKNHIVPDVMCCSGFVRSEWPFTRTIETINKNNLVINRDRRPKVQNAGITKCDIVATNGVINEINDVINVRPRRREPQSFYNSFLNRPFFF